MIDRGLLRLASFRWKSLRPSSDSLSNPSIKPQDISWLVDIKLIDVGLLVRTVEVFPFAKIASVGSALFKFQPWNSVFPAISSPSSKMWSNLREIPRCPTWVPVSATGGLLAVRLAFQWRASCNGVAEVQQLY